MEVYATNHPVEVPKTPGREAEARDTEQGVEDLRVDFQPDLARAIVVIARGVTHGGGSIEEKEEEHCAPSL